MRNCSNNLQNIFSNETIYNIQSELSSKTFITFGTHGGSGIGSYSSLIRSYFPDAKQLESLGIAGADIRSGASKTRVENWLNRIGLDN